MKTFRGEFSQIFTGGEKVMLGGEGDGWDCCW